MPTWDPHSAGVQSVLNDCTQLPPPENHGTAICWLCRSISATKSAQTRPRKFPVAKMHAASPKLFSKSGAGSNPNWPRCRSASDLICSCFSIHSATRLPANATDLLFHPVFVARAGRHRPSPLEQPLHAGLPARAQRGHAHLADAPGRPLHD